MAEVFLSWGRKAGFRRADMLWPVDVWAVQVPIGLQGPNLFQELLLGLLRAGIRDLEQLSSLAALDRQLVAFILAMELQPRGWVDQHFKLTEAGLDMLRGRLPKDHASSVAYAFRDAVTGQWLPFLSADLPEIFPAEHKGNLPVFVLDRDSGRQLRPFMLPRARSLAPADKAGLLPALRMYERQRARDEDDELGEIDLGALEYLDDEPQAAFLWVQAYGVDGDLHPWLVADPRRPQTANRMLRQALAELLTGNSALAAWLEPRLAAAEATTLATDPDMAIALSIEERIQALLPPRGDLALENLREYVARVMRLVDKLHRTPSPRSEELASAVIESGSCLEALLQWMLAQWPIDLEAWPPSWDRRDLRKWLSELPLVAKLDQGCVGALESQAYKTVRRGALDRDQPMKALLVAALLSVHQHEEHPLRQAPVNALDWRLIALRNRGGHASGVRLQRSEVLAFADMSLQWVEKFKPYF